MSETPGTPAPGYRVTVADLSDAAAFQAMHTAATSIVREALATRFGLLTLGFADSHSLCVQLDRTAAEYTVVVEALRRQAAEPQVEAT